jgi:uncharacterized damage-inducible protein DinB
MNVLKLLRYIHAARQCFLDSIKQLPWSDVVADCGACFASIRDIFLHALDCEDKLMNYLLAGHDEEGIHALFDAGRYDNYRNLPDIETRVEEVTQNTKQFLHGLTSEELERVITLPWHADFPTKVENVLMQLIVETLCHYGELMAILWQIGDDPPFLSWINFLKRRVPSGS